MVRVDLVQITQRIAPTSDSNYPAIELEEIEPFLAISKKLLQESHRVRIAAHAAYHAIVQAEGVDFVPIGEGLLDNTVGVPGIILCQ